MSAKKKRKKTAAAGRTLSARAQKLAELQDVARKDRRRFNRFVEANAQSMIEGLGPMSVRLDKGLRKVARGASDITAVELARMQEVARVQVVRMAFALSDRLVVTGAEAYRAGLDSAMRYAKAAGLATTRLQDPLVMEERVRTATAQLTAARQRTMFEYSRQAGLRVSGALVGVQAGTVTRAEARQLVLEALEQEDWQLARIARTEDSIAYNLGLEASIDEVARSENDRGSVRVVYKRWTEHVNDITGAPLDNRVGDDSLAMHGQVARPGKSFVMPDVAKAPSRMVGRRWLAPPNRPNDRAVLLPWTPGSGIPGWLMRDGQRVHL